MGRTVVDGTNSGVQQARIDIRGRASSTEIGGLSAGQERRGGWK
jgi:hypothetical protein